MTRTIRKATTDDAGPLAELAAVTFPLACPPSSSPEDIAAHVANTLSERHFREYLAEAGAAGVWLGVNSQNVGAIRFYEKSGFRKVGSKSFRLGSTVEHDFVLERAVP